MTTPAELEPVADVHFRPGGNSDPLYPYLSHRITCRKPYARRPPSEDVLGKLAQAAESYVDLRVHWVTERSAIRALALLIASTDRIRFEYPSFHEELFRQLRFSATEAERTRDGLDIRTLEVPPGTGLLLRMLRPWKRMQRLNRMGFSRLLSIPSALSVWRSGALGFVTVAKPSAQAFLLGGRGFQRLWLTAQQHELALQPLGSLPIFLGHVEMLGGRHLNEKHRRQLELVAKRFRTIVPASTERTLLLAFRLGFGGTPRVRSLRRVLPEVLAHSAGND